MAQNRERDQKMKLGVIIIAIGESGKSVNDADPLLSNIERDLHVHLNGPKAGPGGSFNGYHGSYGSSVDVEVVVEIEKPHPASSIAILKWAIGNLQQDLARYEKL
jgi:hypothetical protein